MNETTKRILKVIGFGALLLGATGAALGGYQVAKFDASMDRVYDVPVPEITRSTDAAALSRGKHVVESIGACATEHCHGADLAGGKPIALGPIGTLCGPNLTSASLGAAYSDGELARVIKHGLKKDGRSLRFMPAQDFSWLPEQDVAAVVSYLRAVPPVDRPSQSTSIGVLGKVLDRNDQFILDVARRIDPARDAPVPPPEATAAYGAFLGRLCTGCHGEKLSGGPIPGAPSSIPTPLNLTPHPTGLKDWTFADFENVMRRALRKNGQALDPFMPVEAWKNFDETEMHALWAYLQALPPTSFGRR